jgi:hypothetical protein
MVAHDDTPPRTGQHYGNPLTVKVERGAVVVRIGIDVLAHALKFADWAIRFDEAKDDYIQPYKVTDADELARDVIHAMLREEEDGSTPLSDFLDAMTKAAIEDGSCGVDDDPEPSNPFAPEEQHEA